MKVKAGDWVSFYNCGVIVYGKVEYIQNRIGLCTEVCTTIGAVSIDCILEVRRTALNGEDDE